jgi:hypothetical protein
MDAPSAATTSVPPIRVPVNPLTLYLKVRLEVVEGTLRWEVPRALLGVVPVGVRRVAVPVAELRTVAVRTVVHPLHLAVGVACIVFPLLLGLGWAATPLVLLGAWVALVSFGPMVEAKTRSGQRHRAGVCLGHRMDGELYAEAVNDLVVRTVHPPAPT